MIITLKFNTDFPEHKGRQLTDPKPLVKNITDLTERDQESSIMTHYCCCAMVKKITEFLMTLHTRPDSK